MVKIDRDLGESNDPEQAYKEYAELVLPYFGWPEWPPKESPKTSDLVQNASEHPPQKTSPASNQFNRT